MPIVVVDLHLSPEEYQSYYRGTATSVQATARDGRTVNFPANILQQFVTHEGIICTAVSQGVLSGLRQNKCRLSCPVRVRPFVANLSDDC